MDQRQQAAAPVSVFYAYASDAPEDERLRRQLEKHLSLLRRRGLILEWHEGQIAAGMDRTQSLAHHLNTASLILLLVSPDFLASDYCYSVEMQLALERHEAGLARVIPILLRPVDWQEAPFARLQCLPRNEKPVTRWSNRDEAFLDIVRGIHEAITELRGPTSRTIPRQGMASSDQVNQNRLRFLKRVRSTWIAGVLEHSLHQDALIVLGLHEQPAALVNPWHLLMQETDQPPRPLPAGTRVTQVYDEADGALLILGEPGAGKTTLLLELARDLLARAELDGTQPLPVIFNLSSWAQKRQPLASWLLEELRDKYQVPAKLAESWIEADQFVLLLDGLDEVVPAQRSPCMEAINQYLRAHPLASVVVSSRQAEYLAQATRVALRKSVVVQPLTMQQIDEYLTSGGKQLEPVRRALSEDADLQELVTTPFMLSILTVAYNGESLDDLIAMNSPEKRRERVFEKYVTQVFQRRSAVIPYTLQQTRRWLRVLAQQMKRHGQTVFYIDHLQKEWLISKKAQLYYCLNVVLISVFIGGAIGATLTGLGFGVGGGLIGGFGLSLISGLTVGPNPRIRPTDTVIFSWSAMYKARFIMLILTSVGVLVVGLDANPDAVLINIAVSILFSVPFGALIGILSSENLEVIPDIRHIAKPNEEIWRSARYAFFVVLPCISYSLLFILLGNKFGVILVGIFGLLSALGLGGLAFISHFILRFLLWREGTFPWRLPRFLDYAVERMLLRRVGGSYIFIHRLLLEYFARLEE